uniref:Uncharacterized protein n=1 Tax=Clytia hemisphaerica TaxID=252671 RepID=A0A7M5XIM6_9CNID
MRLKAILELKEGSSESLTHITTVINETYPGASAATVHECLVNAFPDLQAQQSNDQEEIYYLGIKLNNYITTEDRVVDWLKTRFKEDKYGSISVSTVSDIANKEIGFQRSSLIGTYLRKAFPEVYVRRSDRLRWYCGITLPEKVMTEEERQRVAWLEAACAWLRQNVKRHENGREKCSLIFAALIQYIGKVGVESCLAAVKCVFPSIQRKTFDRTAYYCDIQLREHVDRDEIQVTESKKTKADLRVLPPITEEEKEMVLWLRNTIQIMERHRERLSDIRCMMIAKLQEDISEKGCLKFLRKAFPAIVYRKREGVAYVGGVEIKEQFRPKEPWVEKAVEW